MNRAKYCKFKLLYCLCLNNIQIQTLVPNIAILSQKKDEIQQEFYEFQPLEETEIPKSPLKEKYYDIADRIDIVWNRIVEMVSEDSTK